MPHQPDHPYRRGPKQPPTIQRHDELEERVRDTIAELLGGDIDEITLDKHLWDDLGADSLDQVELQMLLEERFGVPDPEDGPEFRTVADVVTYVRRHQRRAEAS